MSQKKAPWVCEFKEMRDGGIEYSILRDDNHHGKRSYGWFNDDEKRVVGDNNGHCHVVHSPWLKQELRDLTIRYARMLNAEEGNPDVDVLRSAPVKERRMIDLVTIDTEQFKTPKPEGFEVTLFVDMVINELVSTGAEVHESWRRATAAHALVDTLRKSLGLEPPSDSNKDEPQ